MSSFEVSTFALWLSPTAEAGRPLSKLIERLAQDFSGPLFLPHLTLLSGFELPRDDLVCRTASLASKLRPFPIVTEGIGLAAPPFRALFLPVLLNPGLCQARALAAEIFAIPTGSGFLPHVSLFYGDLPIDRLPKALELARQRMGWGFDAVEVQLICAFGPPSQWQVLRSFPFPAE